MRVIVLGARGQLGAAIVHEFSPRHDVVALDRALLELTDAAAVAAAMARLEPQIIINCAADNAVDAAEDHPIEALSANAFAVRTLARAARAHDAVLVHYSSDFVFDGTARQPHLEDERPNPRSVYATSKMLGEWFAADAPRAYVLRVESLFGRAPGGPALKGSVASIVHGLRFGPPSPCLKTVPFHPRISVTRHGPRGRFSNDARRSACTTVSTPARVRGWNLREKPPGFSPSSRTCTRSAWPT